MGEEVLVLNDLTEYGLRRMHVVSMGRPVERDVWLERVPGEAIEHVNCIQTKEEGLDVWHLWVVWNCREMVTVSPALTPALSQEGEGATRKGVLWYVGKGIPVSFAVEVGAEVYGRTVGRWPGVCLARSWPKEAPELYWWKPGNGTWGSVDVALAVAEWVPQGFVVFMEEI